MYGAQQDLWLYAPFIKKTDRVLDFGCGGGYMLEKIDCNEKYGIDINSQARNEAKKRGIKAYKKLGDLPAGPKFDVIISHHALEHLENPAEVLKSLKKFLKPGGYLIVAVPIDDWRVEKKYDRDDINKHLYTWTPRLLGNLCSQCGYTIKDIGIVERAWVPLSRFYYPYIPKPIYNFFSLLWSKLTLTRQIRIICRQ